MPSSTAIVKRYFKDIASKAVLTNFLFCFGSMLRIICAITNMKKLAATIYFVPEYFSSTHIWVKIYNKV